MSKIAQPLLVPETIEFTGITINISKNAQAIIQNDIKTLLSNKASKRQIRPYFSVFSNRGNEVVATEGISDDFKYVCIQEPGLLPDAVSKSNAVGFGNSKKKLPLILG